MPIMDNPATRELLAKALFQEIQGSEKILKSF